MEWIRLVTDIQKYFDEVLQASTAYAAELRKRFENAHPADKAEILSYLSNKDGVKLFCVLSEDAQQAVFIELSDAKKVAYLSELDEEARRTILSNISVDELADFLDELPDEQLEEYLGLLQKKSRKRVLSLLQFQPETAGAIMTTNVINLLDQFSVGKAVEILQRLQPDRQLHSVIYVTNQDSKLVGNVLIEDLVVQKPSTRLHDILRENTVVAHADQDQEEVVRNMRHYNITNAPVVDENHNLLGIISPNTLMEIIQYESSEDIYRMATMNPAHLKYFEAPIHRLVYQRSSILVVLLLAQSISSMIIGKYEATLTGFLNLFLPMLASTGGNVSSQTSAVVIQGFATGEINYKNVWHFLGREFWISLLIAFLLSLVGMFRAYFLTKGGYFLGSLAVGASLGAITIVSVILGSLIPIALNRMRLDPAYSAGPLLATLMDIVGLFIYCLISSVIIGA